MFRTSIDFQKSFGIQIANGRTFATMWSSTSIGTELLLKQTEATDESVEFFQLLHEDKWYKSTVSS